MEGKRSNISILLVDNDHSTLSMVSTLLQSWEYKVVAVNSGHDAMATLQKYRSYFSLVITNLHMPGMNGVELLQRIKEKFQLPVIIMSEDKRKDVIIHSLEKGAAHYLLKPVSTDDVKDVRRYAVAAEKVKDIKDANSAVPSSGVKISTIEDVNANASSSASGSKKKTNNTKRKASIATNEGQYREKFPAPKKPRVVWTNDLHSHFLMAIRQLGLDRAVPKKIFEIMNIPDLTRENVASHLQKYRLFQKKKVAELLSLEGANENIFTSKLANGLSYVVIKEIQKKVEQIRKSSGSRTTGIFSPTLNPSNTSPILLQASSNASIPQVLSTQLSNASYQGLNLQNQQDPQPNTLSKVRLGGQSLFGSKRANSFQQPILGGYPSVPPCQPNYPYNGGSNFSAYNGSMGSYDSINAANNGLMDGNYGMNYISSVSNNGLLANISQGNGSFNYDPSNGNQLGSFGTSDLPLSSTSYPTSSYNYSGIQGGFAGVDSSSMLSPAFSTNATQQENFSGLPPFPPQLGDLGNAGHESQSTSNSTGKSQPDQFDKELTKLFFLMDSMSLLDEPQEPSNVIAPPTESIANLPNELLTLPNKLQLQGSHESMDLNPVGMYMVEDPAQPNNSATYNDQDWDMDLIEALFGTDPPI